MQKLDPNFKAAAIVGDLCWYDARDLPVEGRGWADTATTFQRLPARAQSIVREPVWELSYHTAGMAVRFCTDAQVINVRWQVRSMELAMPHMPASGMSGVDLYGYHDNAWRWAGCGIPQGAETSVPMGGALLPGMREYLLYFPLYNGIISLEIGISQDAVIRAASRWPIGDAARKPFVVYGTSIVQGGCATRSGMGYPETVARLLDRPSINLGFSGNGPMELELADFLGELDVAAYVVDALPNMSPEVVKERTAAFIMRLRKARPYTPILMISNIVYQRAFLQTPGTAGHEKKNAILREELRKLREDGVSGIHHFDQNDLLGSDGLGTVDGTHPNDLGFHRMAHAIAPALKPLIEDRATIVD